MTGFFASGAIKGRTGRRSGGTVSINQFALFKRAGTIAEKVMRFGF
jgi:hypothetical protein